jgi:hypothetical protein
VFIRYLAAGREGSILRATTTIDRIGANTMAISVRSPMTRSGWL